MGIVMLAIPELDSVSVVFGDIAHMPKQDVIPDEFRRRNGNIYTKAVSTWVFVGGKFENNTLTFGGVDFHPKPGVEARKALRAIKAVLTSLEPKYEDKEAACAFMLSEWFEVGKVGGTSS